MKNFEYYQTSIYYPYPKNIRDRKLRRELLSLYKKEQSELRDEFKLDLFDEFNVADNPKREKCFALAWEEGHSSGYNEVFNYFSDFVELIN